MRFCRPSRDHPDPMERAGVVFPGGIHRRQRAWRTPRPVAPKFCQTTNGACQGDSCLAPRKFLVDRIASVPGTGWEPGCPRDFESSPLPEAPSHRPDLARHDRPRPPAGALRQPGPEAALGSAPEASSPWVTSPRETPTRGCVLIPWTEIARAALPTHGDAEGHAVAPTPQVSRDHAGRGIDANGEGVNHRGRSRRSVSGPSTSMSPATNACDHVMSPRQTSTIRRKLALTITATG